MPTEQEFARLAQNYMDLVYRVALSCIRHPSDANDVTQNTMLRLCRANVSFQSEEHARHWLIRVAVNESKRLLTTPWRSRTLSLEELAATLPDQPQEEREVLSAVLALPKKYRLPLSTRWAAAAGAPRGWIRRAGLCCWSSRTTLGTTVLTEMPLSWRRP